jgi:hypothetical protein
MKMMGDSGSVLLEFALVTPVLLFLIIGSIDLGLAMLQTMQLVFVTQQSAVYEAAHPGQGVAWAQKSLPAATFGVDHSDPTCVTIIGTMPYTPFFLPASWFPGLSDVACAAAPAPA